MRRILKLLTSRLMLFVPLVILQLAVLFSFIYHASIVYSIMPIIRIMAIVMIVYIVNRQEDPSYKIAWCCVILAVPVIGVPLYLLAGNRKVPRKIRYGTIRVDKEMSGLLNADETQLSEEEESIFRYGIENGFPAYKNTSCKYYSTGEEWFADYLEELKKAKHFILMEFFIIVEGKCLEQLLEVLSMKIKEGVDVKLIYDDFGCVTLSKATKKRMKNIGIELNCFNRLRPAFIIQMNNRDHRKLTVIDNQTAFTGGVNISDEYINLITRFGYWKDSAIKIQGEAVWSFTVMFLGMYSYVNGGNVDYEKYHLQSETDSGEGCFQPYSDSPTDNELVALAMHMNMVNRARKYVYMDTPYLILNESMRHALILAAKGGVDVRILTPHIPDKIIVFQITRGNYYQLVKSGVKIYEYTPGFNHAKNFVADDTMAIVGSANMDYRSYFLHFENGVLLYDNKEVLKIRDNFLTSVEKSHEVTLEELENISLPVRLLRAVLNLFVPLV
ncbi:MAG: cardiolipin synthase [Solobacterium sp.]|nr:cardiolipin synthase [Solobacterium sp.]